jgi:hypothetical protein
MSVAIPSSSLASPLGVESFEQRSDQLPHRTLRQAVLSELTQTGGDECNTEMTAAGSW